MTDGIITCQMTGEHMSITYNKLRTSLSIPLLRDILILLILCILAWKLLNTEIVINLEKFGFTELLSVLLAFFAVALSVTFYFKATETSNRFYDNAYKFTKDTSEMLGRIEAGFGGRLKLLDEGYSGLKDQFDQMPFDLNKAKSEVQKEKQDVEKKEKERLQIFEELARRAKLQENEKQRMFSEMESKEKELMEARKELGRLQSEIRDAEFSEDVPHRLIRYIEDNLGFLRSSKYLNAPSNVIQRRFDQIKEDFHSEAIEDMKRSGLIDEDGDLSRKGISFIRRFIRHAI